MKYKRPDHKNALSILDAAERDMNFTLTIDPTDESGPTIIRNVYECFRMVGDALLLARGIESEDHVTSIKELLSLNVETIRPINLVENMRWLRHNVNYYGYTPKLVEVKDVISIAETIFQPVLREARKKVVE